MSKNETEVRLSDLMAMLLKGSRAILCLVLVFGLLGAAYGAYSVIKTQPQVAQGRVEAAEKNVEIAQSNVIGIQNAISYRREVLIPRAEQKVVRAERLAIEMQEYMENSIYYGMNPFHRGAARLRFAVETNGTDPAEDPRAGIVLAYTQMCPFPADTMAQVQRILGVDTETQYLEELISVENIEGHFVEICFWYDDLPLAEKVVDLLYETMAAQGAERLQPHTTKVLSLYTGYEVDWTMSERHIASEESLAKAEQDLQDATVSLMELHNDILGEQDLANTSDSLYDAEKALRSTRSNTSMMKRAMKYGIIGAVLGFLLGCGYVLARGLFSGIIQNQSEVTNRYAFPLIGVLPRSKKIWFDGAIRKLEGDPEGSREAVTQATVQSLVSRVGERAVCLVSAGDSAVPKKLAAYTGDRFPVIDNIIDSADAVKELAHYDGIVLVEERGRSRVDLVDAEVLRARALNKEIIGIVLA